MIGAILNTARSAIFAQQTAVQVTAQNISNAQTPGYSRQRVDLATAPSARTVHGVLGSGVMIAGVSRAHDALLDATYRRESGNAAGFGLRHEVLQQVEEIFGELSDSGFSATLDAFWASWSELASSPLSASARGMVHKRADQLGFALNNYASGLQTLTRDIDARLDRTIDEANHLIRQVADLNRQISRAEIGGQQAPDLRDQRGLVLDTLAGIAAVQVSARSDGTVAVHLGTTSLVDGAVSSEITLDANSRPRVGSMLLQDPGGTMGALLDLRQHELPRLQARLDTFTRSLVEEVNARHTAGTGGLNFFDPAGLTASTIRLSSDVDDPGLVGTVPGVPGDNSVALELAGLREVRVSFPPGGETTFGGYFNDVVTGIGLQVNAADRSGSVYRTLSSQAGIRRSSVTGVSTEEEMMNLMRHQQAYQAATRLVQTADEMMKTILNMV